MYFGILAIVVHFFSFRIGLLWGFGTTKDSTVLHYFVGFFYKRPYFEKRIEKLLNT